MKKSILILANVIVVAFGVYLYVDYTKSEQEVQFIISQVTEQLSAR
jgi:hypothetical protein